LPRLHHRSSNILLDFAMRFLPALAASAVAALLSALPAQAQAPAQRVFRLATSTDAATLDPHATNALFTFLVVSQVYEPLILRADDLKLRPGLALSWEQVEPSRWRFRLRPDVRFAGGETFASDDVGFSVTRALAPTSNLPNAIFSQRLRRQETAFFALSWGVPTFDATYTMRAVMASRSIGGGAS
jgi:ABC-type transport system substrate-binding protein